MDKGWLNFLLPDFLLKRMDGVCAVENTARSADLGSAMRSKKKNIIRISSHDTAWGILTWWAYFLFSLLAAVSCLSAAASCY